MAELRTWADGTITVKPCPFCGTHPEWKHIGNAHTKGRKIELHCPECRVKLLNGAIYHDFEWLERITAEQWNRRVATSGAPTHPEGAADAQGVKR